MGRTFYRTPKTVSWVCGLCQHRIKMKDSHDAIEVSEPGAAHREYAHGRCVRTALVGKLSDGQPLHGHAARAALRVIEGGKA